MPSPDPAALLELAPADLWGLWTLGEFSSPTRETAARRWVDMVLREYPSVLNLIEELGFGANERMILQRFGSGPSRDEVLPRVVYLLRVGLGSVTDEPLADPVIPGDSDTAVRSRLRWARLRYYRNYLSKMADEMGVSRSYIAHFLADEHRGLTDFLVEGMYRAGFRPDWVRYGTGTPRR